GNRRRDAEMRPGRDRHEGLAADAEGHHIAVAGGRVVQLADVVDRGGGEDRAVELRRLPRLPVEPQVRDQGLDAAHAQSPTKGTKPPQIMRLPSKGMLFSHSLKRGSSITFLLISSRFWREG